MQIYNDDYFNKFGVRSECDENKVLHSAKLKAYKQFDTSSFVDFYNVTLKTPIDESDITPVEKREFLMLIPNGEVLSNYTKYEIKNYSPSKQEWEIAVTLDKQELLNDFVNEAWFIEIPEGTNQNELKAKLKKQLREFDFSTVADKNHFITLVEISNYLNDYGHMFANECPLVLADVLDYNRYFSFLLEKISVLHKRINNSRAQWVLKRLMDEEVDAKFSFERLTNDSNPENFKRYDIYFIKLLHFQVTEPAIQYHNKLLSAIGNAITAIFQPEALTSTFELAGYQIANDEIAEDFRAFFNTTKEQILRSFPRGYYSTITVTKEEIYEETLSRISKTLAQKLKRPRAHKKMTMTVSLTSSAQNRLNQLSQQNHNKKEVSWSGSELVELVAYIIIIGCGLYFLVTFTGLLFYCFCYAITGGYGYLFTRLMGVSIDKLSLWGLIKDFYSLHHSVLIAILMAISVGIILYLDNQREKRKVLKTN